MRILLGALLLTIPAIRTDAQTSADCVKRVFNAYCLGAAVSTLPKPDSKLGDRWLYRGTPYTVVTTFSGRVASVSRAHQPGAWLTYRDVESDVVEKYGPGEDRSQFPPWATDDLGKEIAITAEKGRAVRYWPQDGYEISLMWRSKEFVMLTYAHEALEAARVAKQKDEY